MSPLRQMTKCFVFEIRMGIWKFGDINCPFKFQNTPKNHSAPLKHYDSFMNCEIVLECGLGLAKLICTAEFQIEWTVKQICCDLEANLNISARHNTLHNSYLLNALSQNTPTVFCFHKNHLQHPNSLLTAVRYTNYAIVTNDEWWVLNSDS